MAAKKTGSKKKTRKAAGKVKPSATPSMEALKDFVRSRGAEFLKDPNISSVGIGYKTTGGKTTKAISVQFTVQEKAVPEALERLGTRPIPESFNIGGVDVPTDVVKRQFSAEFKIVAEATASDRKEPSGNKYSMSPCSSRVNRVIPVTVEAMPFEAHRGHLGARHGDPARIVAAIQL